MLIGRRQIFDKAQVTQSKRSCSDEKGDENDNEIDDGYNNNKRDDLKNTKT